MKNIVLLLVVLFGVSACASLVINRYQDVTIKTDDKNSLFVNDIQVESGDITVPLERDGTSQAIVLKREGYKDEHHAVLQYKLSPWHALSYASSIGAITAFLTLKDLHIGVRFFGSIASLYIPVYDHSSPRIWNYDKEIKVEHSLIKIPEKKENMSFINRNKVDAQVDKGNYKYMLFYSYNKYRKGDFSTNIIGRHWNSLIQVKKNIFAELLDDILNDIAFADTNNSIIEMSFLNNHFLDAKIEDIRIKHVGIPGFIYAEYKICFTLLDYYYKAKYSEKQEVKSGLFAIKDSDMINKDLTNSFKDALEKALFNFINSKEVQKILTDSSQKNIEDSYQELLIAAPHGNSVSNVKDAIKSTLTVKNKSSHGSGFIIGQDGYIITSYQNISDTHDLKVILNDNSEHAVEIIRESKIHDLALIKINKKDLKPFTLGRTDDILVGQSVYVIGTPNVEDLSQTISKGIISGIRTNQTGNKIIQTDASVNLGHNGGVIIDQNGILLGSISSKMIGFGVEGIAFGIPCDIITESLNIRLE